MLIRGQFYVYEGKPVSIGEEPEIDGLIKITHITQFSDENGDIFREPRQEIVWVDKLQLLTKKMANELIKDYNVTIHALKNCLRYM